MNYVALENALRRSREVPMLLCGLTFAVMLIVQQGSISGARRWVAVEHQQHQCRSGSPTPESVRSTKSNHCRYRGRSCGAYPGGVGRSPYKGVLRARLQRGLSPDHADRMDAPTLIGRPAEVLEGRFEDILEPMPSSWINGRLNEWGPSVIGIGTIFELNDKLARVVAIAKTQKSFTNILWSIPPTNARFAMSRVSAGRCRTCSLRQKDGIPASEVTSRIHEQTGTGCSAPKSSAGRPSAGFSKYRDRHQQFRHHDILALSSAWRSRDRHFICLPSKTRNSSVRSKRWEPPPSRSHGMILLQAFTVGLTGYGIGIGLPRIRISSAKGGGLPFVETRQLLLLVLLALLGICTLSA